jgi:hypothetical protein
MSVDYYELGRSGREACCSCTTFADLGRAGAQLAPGEYWIKKVEWILDECLEWAELLCDYGTLEVTGDGDWCLRTLSGLQAGPGYLVI